MICWSWLRRRFHQVTYATEIQFSKNQSKSFMSRINRGIECKTCVRLRREHLHAMRFYCKKSVSLKKLKFWPCPSKNHVFRCFWRFFHFEMSQVQYQKKNLQLFFTQTVRAMSLYIPAMFRVCVIIFSVWDWHICENPRNTLFIAILKK